VKSLDRATVWRRLGAPADQIGSVNDPRTVREHGVSWNEKWVHLDDRGNVERVVLWDRYDLVGIFRVDGAGTWQAELLPEE
jgi:hypothetical protein